MNYLKRRKRNTSVNRKVAGSGPARCDSREGHVVHAGVHVNCVCNVCGSAHSCGCVVNGSFAKAAF